MECAPINPSDLGVMFANADLGTVEPLAGSEGSAGPGVQARLSPAALEAARPRMGLDIPAGNEGSGVVVEAWPAPEAQALLGKVVGIRGGGMYSQYRVLAARHCLALPEGTTPREGASCFVNPLTALGMAETLRREGHRGLAHTAAASNLGQMLQKICTAEGIPLVNIVRRPEQAELLRGLGAVFVCDTSRPDFDGALCGAFVEAGVTLAFDATGGGELADRILAAMERAASRGAGEYSRYGSTVHKQVYLYGSLEPGPTVLMRRYGMAWEVGGWLLTNFLDSIGPEKVERLMGRVAREIKTTFASHYTRSVDLAGALDPRAIAEYGQRATGHKYLIELRGG